MSNPYIGEIRMFAGNFAPQGWAFCDGSLQPIAGNEALFSLLGTTYGGDGVNTFALPDLRSRVPIHMGNSFVQGQNGGAENVTLTLQQIPSHQHSLVASRNLGVASTPSNNVFAQVPAGGIQLYTQDNTVLATTTPVALAGGGLPHENRQPMLTVTFIISLFGIFPPKN